MTESDDLAGRLGVLEAKEEIRNLLQEYRRTLDARDLRGFSALFASSGTWTWKGRAVETSDGLSPKIDLGKDGLDTQVMDVDFDGLVDVVITTGTEVQTYFSLGRFPGGDGRFGQGKWTGATTATLSTEPVRPCVPWSSTPVRFSDSDIKTADLNGDGITDIVRVRK
ncbi:hypothetical protein B4Q13_15385, partial [Lacticaseibacillus rhamnosus]